MFIHRSTDEPLTTVLEQPNILITYCSGKTKVTELHYSSLGDENIFWLYITVDDLSKSMEEGRREN